MADNNMKEVDYAQYCPTCVNANKKGEDDPCDDCLAEPARLYSHKPVNYKEKE